MYVAPSDDSLIISRRPTQLIGSNLWVYLGYYDYGFNAAYCVEQPLIGKYLVSHSRQCVTSSSLIILPDGSMGIVYCVRHFLYGYGFLSDGKR